MDLTWFIGSAVAGYALFLMHAGLGWDMVGIWFLWVVFLGWYSRPMRRKRALQVSSVSPRTLATNSLVSSRTPGAAADGGGARVVNLSEASLNPGLEKALRLTGVITRLAPGSRTLRFFVGYGVGRSKAQVETHFVDVQSGQVVMVTADRRAAARGLFGGDSEGHLRESFEEMTLDLGRFLQRLAKGQVRLRPMG
jgi:hypothetical protein